jgi:hypothetical protein
MKPRQVAHLTLFAGLALLLSACMATPITLPLTEFGAGPMDAGMAYDNVGLDMDPEGKGDGPGHPFTDSGNAMDGFMDAFNNDGEAGITEGGTGEGGITEGGPGEGGITDLVSTD